MLRLTAKTSSQSVENCSTVLQLSGWVLEAHENVAVEGHGEVRSKLGASYR